MDSNKKFEFLITDGFIKVTTRMKRLEKTIEDGFKEQGKKIDDLCDRIDVHENRIVELEKAE